MLNSFETRLTEILSDSLLEWPEPHAVIRQGSELPPLNPNDSRTVIAVQMVSAEHSERLGDDALDRIGMKGDYHLKKILGLNGTIELTVSFEGNTDGVSPRVLQMQAVDRILLALHIDTLRNGMSFTTEEDLGFQLDGFRLEHINSSRSETTIIPEVNIAYNFSGSFWPIEPLMQGPVITDTPTRIAVLPVTIPADLSVHAGTANLPIPIQGDLRVMGSAVLRLYARLRNNGGPGILIGITDGLPEGFVAYEPDENSTFMVTYQPPETVATTTVVETELCFIDEEDTTIEIGRVSIKVLP
jgi:hypothetical protein